MYNCNLASTIPRAGLKTCGLFNCQPEVITSGRETRPSMLQHNNNKQPQLPDRRGSENKKLARSAMKNWGYSR